jgi:hypothetical protein
VSLPGVMFSQTDENFDNVAFQRQWPDRNSLTGHRSPIRLVGTALLQ